jgi:hypothetical protein
MRAAIVIVSGHYCYASVSAMIRSSQADRESQCVVLAVDNKAMALTDADCSRPKGGSGESGQRRQRRLFLLSTRLKSMNEASARARDHYVAQNSISHSGCVIREATDSVA